MDKSVGKGFFKVHFAVHIESTHGCIQVKVIDGQASVIETTVYVDSVDASSGDMPAAIVQRKIDIGVVQGALYSGTRLDGSRRIMGQRNKVFNF